MVDDSICNITNLTSRFKDEHRDLHVLGVIPSRVKSTSRDEIFSSEHGAGAIRQSGCTRTIGKRGPLRPVVVLGFDHPRSQSADRCGSLFENGSAGDRFKSITRIHQSLNPVRLGSTIDVGNGDPFSLRRIEGIVPASRKPEWLLGENPHWNPVRFRPLTLRVMPRPENLGSTIARPVIDGNHLERPICLRTNRRHTVVNPMRSIAHAHGDRHERGAHAHASRVKTSRSRLQFSLVSVDVNRRTTPLPGWP